MEAVSTSDMVALNNHTASIGMYEALLAMAKQLQATHRDYMVAKYGLGKEDVVDANGTIKRKPKPAENVAPIREPDKQE